MLELRGEELDHLPPPVVILSSSATREDICEGYDRDVTAYLTKPDDLCGFNAMARAIEEFWIETARHS